MALWSQWITCPRLATVLVLSLFRHSLTHNERAGNNACRAALAGAWTSKVPFNTAASIPLQLWQTSGSRQLRGRAQQLRHSWQRLNPNLNATLMDDAEAEAFIRSFFGRHTHAVYAAYPLNVMRADFWRYAVLYAYGGVYADIDTECRQPIKQWFPPRTKRDEDPAFVIDAPTWQAAGPLQYSNLTWEDCSLVAGLENDAHICQWIIAAAPGHPILQAALQSALRNAGQGFDCTYAHMVHGHTGPAVWTSAFVEVLGLPRETNAAGIARAAWTNATVYQRARELGVCIVAPTFWGAPGNSTAQNARNWYSSQWSKGHPNTPWLKDKDQLVAQLKKVPAVQLD